MARDIPFGEREGGIAPPALDRDEVSDDLRIGIWNASNPWLFAPSGEAQYFRSRMLAMFRELNWPADEIDTTSLTLERRVKKWLLNDETPWTRFYQFVELLPRLASVHSNQELKRVVAIGVNHALERHGSRYRLVGDRLAPITSEEEIGEIRAAASAPERFSPARDHIVQALAHLAQMPDPAYRDCIKEAMSAAESVLWIATGNKEDFAKALRQFETQFGELHGSLRQTFKSLYGYASDEEGVRHGATEASDVGEREARLMLVTCSAVMNFLIRKAEGI